MFSKFDLLYHKGIKGFFSRFWCWSKVKETTEHCALKVRLAICDFVVWNSSSLQSKRTSNELQLRGKICDFIFAHFLVYYIYIHLFTSLFFFFSLCLFQLSHFNLNEKKEKYMKLIHFTVVQTTISTGK